MKEVGEEVPRHQESWCEPGMAQAKSPESREKKFDTREFVYRDAEGKMLGKTTVSFGESEEQWKMQAAPNEESIRCRPLVHMEFHGPKGTVRLDELVDAAVLKKRILIPEERQVLYATQPDKQNTQIIDGEVVPLRIALVPMPEAPIDLAVLLHELGHLEQENDPASGSVLNASAEVQMLRANGLAEGQTIYSVVEEITKAIPQLLLKRTPEFDAKVKAMDVLIDAGQMLREDAESIREIAVTPGAKGVSRSDLEAMYAEVGRKIQEIEVKKNRLDEEIHLKKILSLPERILERDATAKSFKKLSQIKKKTGMDVFAKHAAAAETTVGLPNEYGGEPESCADSVEDGLPQKDGSRQTIVETRRVMKGYLASYGAEKNPLRALKQELPPLFDANRTRE